MSDSDVPLYLGDDSDLGDEPELQMESEMAALKNVLDEQEKKFAELEKLSCENIELKRKNKEKDEAIEDASARLNVFGEQLKLANAQIEQIKAMNVSLQQENRSKQEYVSQYDARERKLAENFTKEKQALAQKYQEANNSLSKLSIAVTDFLKFLEQNYQIPFSSLAEAKNYLSTHSKSNSDAQSFSRSFAGSSDDLQTSNRRIKDLKKQLKNFAAEANESRNQMQATIDSLEQQLQEMTESAEQKEISSKEEYLNISNEKEELKHSYEILESNYKALQEKTNNRSGLEMITSENQKLKSVIDEKEAIIRKMKSKINKLGNALSNANQQMQETEQRIDEQNIQIEEQLITIEDLKSTLQEQNEDAEKDTMDLNDKADKIQAFEQAMKQKDIQLENLNSSLNDAQLQIGQHQNIIKRLQSDNTSLIKSNEDLKSKIAEKDIAIQEIESSSKNAQESIEKQLSQANEEIAKLKSNQNKQPGETVPIQTWTSIDVQPELKVILQQIGSNSTMQLPTKIIAAMRSILDFKSTNIIIEEDPLLKLLQNKNQFLESLIEPVCSLVDQHIPPDNISEDVEACTNYVNQINEKIEEFNIIKENSSQNSIIVRDLIDVLQINLPSLILPTVKELQMLKDKSSDEVLQVKKELENALFDQDQLENELSEYKEAYEAQMNEQLEQVKQLKQVYNETCRNLHQKTLEAQAANMKLLSIKKIHCSEINDAEEKSKARIQDVIKNCEIEKNKLKEEIIEKQKQFNQLSELLERQQSKVRQLKNALRNQTEDYESSLEKQNQFFAQRTRQDQENAVSEISQMRIFYDGILSTLKSKKEDLENQLSDSFNTLQIHSTTIQQQNKKIFQLEAEKKNYSHSLSKMKTQTEMKLKIMETKFKTEQISFQNKIRSSNEQQQTDLEQTKRNIFGYITSQFARFYNAHDKINEEIIKEILSKVHQELERLSKEDQVIRATIGLSPNEPIETALSKMYNKSKQ